MLRTHVCTQCHSVGAPVQRKSGYKAVSWGLFSVFIVSYTGIASLNMVTKDHSSAGELVFVWGLFVAWLLHLLFRAVTAKMVCPACGSSGMVPVDSPHGRTLAPPQ